MIETNLLASVALFSELYNSPSYSNIYDIIAEFIKGAVASEKKWVISSSELTDLLKKNYDFTIPGSVIKSTVKNRLKTQVEVKEGVYYFNQAIAVGHNRIDAEYNTIQSRHNGIILRLIAFVEQQQSFMLDHSERSLLIQDFGSYLMDMKLNEKYSAFISAFVIKNQHDTTFTDSLNLIKEGLILYQGVRFTANLNELGTWNNRLTIFLSTEYLFNAMGYNGLLYQEIFNDFFKLVTEINQSHRNKNSDKKIELRFFEETKDEIDSFFATAEKILNNEQRLDPSRPAMRSILNGCKALSDIKEKKIRFYIDLRQMGILLQEFKTTVYDYHDYVVEDQTVLEMLKKEALEKKRPFDEEACVNFFKIFTKINYYRGGLSKTSIENVEYLFLTSNSFALYLARNNKVKFQEGDIPFAKGMDYITNKFWFKLKKGFSARHNLPKTFDVVTKAQIVLSHLLSQTLSGRFDILQKDFKEGRLTREEALERSYEMREKSVMPEDINEQNVSSSLDFLFDDAYFETILEEKEAKESALNRAVAENKNLRSEIEQYKAKEKNIIDAWENENKAMLQNSFCQKKWTEYVKKNNKDAVFFMKVNALTILSVLIALVLKVVEPLNNWMKSLGNGQYIIWGGLVIVTLFEIMARSYIIDKARVKNGWEWIRLCLSKSRMTALKKAQFELYKVQFLSSIVTESDKLMNVKILSIPNSTVVY